MRVNLYVSEATSGRILRRSWSLVVCEGPDRGAELALRRSPALVGAAPGAEARLSDETVSRFHAELDLEPDGVRLRDLLSTNGCRVHGLRVERAFLRPGARLSVGGTVLEIRAVDEPAPEPVAPTSLAAGLVAAAPATARVAAWVAALAPLAQGVAFVGPRGSGRWTWARALHAQSPRADAPWRVYAAQDRPDGADLLGSTGALAQAGAGTLLLDEPAALDPAVQGALRSALEEGLDARVIARSEHGLLGRLVPGLAERIAPVELVLPSLADRPEDRRAIVEAELVGFGLDGVGPALESALARSAARVGFEEILDALHAPWPALPSETPPVAALRRAFLEDLLAYLDGDVDHAAARMGREPGTLLDELARRDVPLPE